MFKFSKSSHVYHLFLWPMFHSKLLNNQMVFPDGVSPCLLLKSPWITIKQLKIPYKFSQTNMSSLWAPKKGDILLTCFGSLSRNRRVGVRLGKGDPFEVRFRGSPSWDVVDGPPQWCLVVYDLNDYGYYSYISIKKIKKHLPKTRKSIVI